MISRTPAVVSDCRGRGWGIELAAITHADTTMTAPSTQPTRNGRADWLRLSDSRMRIVAMTGTELKAAATPMGSSAPKACSMAPLHHLVVA